MQAQFTQLQLPVSVVSKVDLGRLTRELEALNIFLESAAVRQPGTAMKLPKTSRLFDELVQVNKLNALVDTDRKQLAEFLESVREEAPTLHISFSADPSALFAQRITTWLRQEIHPHVLLQVGLQPGIGAGAILRSTNQYFDFSLRERFLSKREILIQKLKSAPIEQGDTDPGNSQVATNVDATPADVSNTVNKPSATPVASVAVPIPIPAAPVPTTAVTKPSLSAPAAVASVQPVLSAPVAAPAAPLQPTQDITRPVAPPAQPLKTVELATQTIIAAPPAIPTHPSPPTEEHPSKTITVQVQGDSS